LDDCAAEAEQHVVENPCGCEALPIACAKAVSMYEECFESYGDYYDANTECLEAQEDALPQVDFRKDPYFVASYAILSIVTGLVFLWCLFNRILMPIADSSVESTMAGGKVWTMTGYKYHPIGSLVHWLVKLVLVGIQFELFVLTIFYYMQQEAITRWEPVFYDEVQVLMAFEIVWMVGFVWSFAFRYPSSIHDLFLRRCSLSQASFVAVSAPTRTLEAPEDAPGWGEKVMASYWWPFDLGLRLFFSYPVEERGYDTIFCPVETDEATGKRAFYHRLRRFVYSDGNFLPGTMSVGETLGDFLKQVEGLSSEEAQKRYGQTGSNNIPLKKPNVLGSIVDEFCKPFYLYQNFMVWSWYVNTFWDQCFFFGGGLYL